MAGANKRVASRVPMTYRVELDKLSKADLMELVWDFATRAVGEEKPNAEVYREAAYTARILANADGRKMPKLSTFADGSDGHLR